jgi:hypothetical protein
VTLTLSSNRSIKFSTRASADARPVGVLIDRQTLNEEVESNLRRV